PVYSSSPSLHPLPLHSFPTRRSSDLFPAFAPYAHDLQPGGGHPPEGGPGRPVSRGRQHYARPACRREGRRSAGLAACACAKGDRSEEHTSELQSLRHLVCRLLLEKKN